MFDNFLSSLAHAKSIREWLGVILSPTVSIVGFGFVLRQLRISEDTYRSSAKKTEIEQNWKKAEFIAKEAREFFGDVRVERVISMLDWSIRRFVFKDLGNDEFLIISDEGLRNSTFKETVEDFISRSKCACVQMALRIHKDSDQFSDVERLLRDEFDWFFFRLGVFQHFIDTNVIQYNEIDGFLNYIVDLVGDNHSPILTETLINYIEYYKFISVKKLVLARMNYRSAYQSQ